jgi:hypothetical protein
MKRPKQLPAVDRNNVTKRAAVPVGAGGNVHASFDWGGLISTIGNVASHIPWGSIF